MIKLIFTLIIATSLVSCMATSEVPDSAYRAKEIELLDSKSIYNLPYLYSKERREFLKRDSINNPHYYQNKK